MIYYTHKTHVVQQFIADILCNKIPTNNIGFGVLDVPLTWVGEKQDLVNKEQLQRAQISTQNTEGAAGGTGIISPGSIAIIKHTKRREEVYKFIDAVFQLLIRKLSARNILCHREGNDLVLTAGNRKLCGYSVGQTANNTFFGGLYINIYVDIKLIDKVCVKKRSPFALSEYGITSEEVVSWFHELWKENWIQLD